MKTVVSRAIRDEKGAALVLAIILLLVGGLITSSLLAHMGTGILTGEVYERRTAELYAADAGVEDAIWKIQKGDAPVCPATPEWSYSIADVNSRGVEVSIEYLQEGVYRITSTAYTQDGSGTAAIPSSTTVESYLSASYMDFSSLLDYAIVSDSTIDIQCNPKTHVGGDVWLPDDAYLDGEGCVNGTPYDFKHDGVTLTWPRSKDLSDYYWPDVKHLEEEAHPDGYIIGVGGTSEGDPYVVGPLLADGDLTIKEDGWIRLEGTIYVKGSLTLMPGVNINLNKETIFVEREIDFQPGVTIYSSGCIIAVGNIKFQPNLSGEGGQYVLVLSVQGKTTFQPGPNFHGTVAGSGGVQLQPNCAIDWTKWEDKDLNFPTGHGDGDELPPVTGVSVVSWELK